MTILRKLALGLYQLRTGWKTDRDRRLQLPAVLTAMLVLNLISLRTIIQDVFQIGIGTRSGDLPILVLLFVMVMIWLVMHKLVVTDQAYSEIKLRSMNDTNCTDARSFFVVYLVATILLIVAALVLVIII